MPSSCTGTQLRLLVYRSLGLPAWKGTDACLWHSLYSPQSWKSLLSGPLQKRSGGLLVYTRASPVAQQVKSPPAMQEMRVRFLGGEDPLEEGMSTHSNILGCLGNPMDRWAWWATVHGVAKSWAQLSPYMCVCAHTHTHKSVLQGEMLYINIYRFLQSIWVLRKGETNIYLTHHVRWEKRYTGELYFKTQCTKSPAFKTEKLKGSYLHNKFSVSFYKRIHHGVPL